MGFVVVKKGLMSSATPIDVFIRGLFPPTCPTIPCHHSNKIKLMLIEHNFLNFLESFPFGKAYCTVCTRMDFQLKSLMMATWYQWTCCQIGVHCAPNVRILSLEEPKWEGTTVWKSRKVALWEVGLIGTPNDRMARRCARCRANQSEDSQETK